MSKTIFKIIALCILSLFTLSACQQTFHYDYLMKHPEVLEKEYRDCQHQVTARCDEVIRAAEDFRILITQRNENPESVGLQIMQAQQKGDKQRVQVLYAVVRASL